MFTCNVFKKADERPDFAEIGFKATCFQVNDQNWHFLQTTVDKATSRVEGFLCIVAHLPDDPQETISPSILQPVYLFTTVDNNSIKLAENSKDLVKPLIFKFKCIVEENCTVASRQLSESVSCPGPDGCLLLKWFSVLKFLAIAARTPGCFLGFYTTLKFSKAWLRTTKYWFKI